MSLNAPEELDQERDRATQLLSAPVLPSVRAKEIVSLFKDQVRSATSPEELENVYSALEALIQSAIILHANKQVDLRRAAVTDSQRAKDFLHNVACGPWYRLEDREPLLGDSVLFSVERNGCQHYRLGNHEPEERVVCWARIYPPRVSS